MMANKIEICLKCEREDDVPIHFMIWSDNDTEHDADGKQITEVVGGMVVPKCLPEKAHNVKLDLTLPN